MPAEQTRPASDGQQRSFRRLPWLILEHVRRARSTPAPASPLVAPPRHDRYCRTRVVRGYWRTAAAPPKMHKPDRIAVLIRGRPATPVMATEMSANECARCHQPMAHATARSLALSLQASRAARRARSSLCSLVARRQTPFAAVRWLPAPPESTEASRPPVQDSAVISVRFLRFASASTSPARCTMVFVNLAKFDLHRRPRCLRPRAR